MRKPSAIRTPDLVQRLVLTTSSLAHLASTLPSSSTAFDDLLFADPEQRSLHRFRGQYRDVERARSVTHNDASAGTQAGSGNGYFYGQQPLVHTFETQASCMRRCTLSCVVQNVEDLMMPRWICPSHQSPEVAMNSSPSDSTDFLVLVDNQFILLLVPLALLLIIALIILWVRRSSSSTEDELV